MCITVCVRRNVTLDFYIIYVISLKVLSFFRSLSILLRLVFYCNLGLQQLLFTKLCILTMFAAIFQKSQFLLRLVFFLDFIASLQISIFLVNVLNACKFLPISEEEFAELQIRLFCVEDMSSEPSELIPAFESKANKTLFW